MSEQKKRGTENVGEIFHRSLSIESFEKKRMDGDDSPEIYEFTLSSEEPVEVWYREIEILSHSAESVRMAFIGSGNAPLLWMHDRSDARGIVLGARIEGGKLIVMVRFGESEKAQELKKEVDAGTIKNVSVGYRVHAYHLEEQREDGVEVYRATDWEPLEASFVTIPADKTVGMGRSRSLKTLLSENDKHEKPSSQSRQQTKIMSEPKDPPPIDLDKERGDAVAAERIRQKNIRNASQRIKGYDDAKVRDLADKAIEDGDSVESFNARALEFISENAPKLDQSSLGATVKEQKRYSLLNVMNGLANNDLSRCQYEIEISDEIKKRSGKDSGKLAIPQDVLVRSWIPQNEAHCRMWCDAFGMSQRDIQSVSLTGAGQANTVATIVETELLEELFVYALRENNALLNSGVMMLSGLVGDAEIPVELLNPEFYWVGEEAEPTEGTYGLGTVDLKFKTLAARIGYTRRAEKQSTPSIERILTRNLRIGAGLALERALYTGAGTATEPLGILNTAGVGSVASGGAYSRDLLIDFFAALGNANVSGNPKLFMPVQAAAEFAKTLVDPGSGKFAATINPDDSTRVMTEIGGGCVTNLIPSSATGAANTSVIYGKPESLTVGMWGAMELDVDRTTRRNVGGTDLRVWLDADTAVAQPANWAASTDLP